MCSDWMFAEAGCVSADCSLQNPNAKSKRDLLVKARDPGGTAFKFSSRRNPQSGSEGTGGP